MYRASLPSVVAAALLASLATQRAEAADYLRGSYAGETAPQQVAGPDWGGFYAGAHAGYSAVHNRPGNMAAPVVAATSYPAAYLPMMPGATAAFPNTIKNGVGFGGFVGVNYLWDEVVLGIEGDYTRSSVKADSRVGPQTFNSGGAIPQYVLTNLQRSNARPSDIATLRGRAGYAMGMFMPYLTVGLALGNVDTRTSNSGTWTEYNTGTGAVVASGSYSATGGRKGMMYGAAYGAGLDMQFLPNTFVRAEWQAVQFAQKTGRPDVMVQTGRVGAGVKF